MPVSHLAPILLQDAALADQGTQSGALARCEASPAAALPIPHSEQEGQWLLCRLDISRQQRHQEQCLVLSTFILLVATAEGTRHVTAELLRLSLQPVYAPHSRPLAAPDMLSFANAERNAEALV